MANKLYEEESIQAIADAIRANAPESVGDSTFTVAEMPDGIGAVYSEGYRAGAEAGSSPSVDTTTVWQINAEPDLTTLPVGYENFMRCSFTSNDVQYDGIGRVPVGSNSWGIYSLSYGIYGSYGSQNVYTYNPSGSYGISHGWKNEAYRTITIHEEITDAKLYLWLMANATLISGEVEIPYQPSIDVNLETEDKTVTGAINELNKKAVEMPIIRFIGLRGNNILCDEENEPTSIDFTVGIDSGSLQVGDALQICGMRTFWASPKNPAKKRKLRRFAEYVITEDDLDKNTLVLTVNPTKNAFAHLGHNNRAGGGPTTIYFRIRRPVGDLQRNDSGMTVDAKFSNVVPVSMMYADIGDEGYNALSIKPI